MTKETKPPASQDAPADAPGDFFFDELMTPQPDATQEFLRQRLRVIEAEQRARDAAKAKD
jgi:hypothetical protein